jgi:TolA-binding protein
MSERTTSQLEHERERDFERRWTRAGATAEDLGSIRAGLLTAPPTRRRRLDRAWQRIAARTAAPRHEWRSLFIAAAAGATLAGSAVFLVRPLIDSRPPPVARANPRILFEHGAAVLSPGGAISRGKDGELVLERGTVQVELDRGSRGAPPLRFRAGDLALEASEAIFALHVEDALASVRVYDGAVTLTEANAAPVRIDRWSGLVPIARAWDPAELAETDRWGSDAERRRSAASGAGDDGRAPALATSDARVPAAETPESIETHESARARRGTSRRAPPRAFERRVARALSLDAESAASAASEPALNRGPTAEERVEPRIEVKPAANGEVAAGETPEISRPVRAEGARSAGDDNLARLEQLQRRVSPARREEISAYVGGLKALRNGSRAEAARIFQRYLDRFPGGILREEAELSKLEALYASESFEAFETEARAWLAAHPKHDRSREIEALISGLR